MQLPARVYAEINLDAICQNVQNAMDKVGKDTKMMAIIKTDAYGHGAVPVAKALKEIGTYAFGVATVEEAVQLRRAGIENPILILGYVFPADYELLIENDIMHAVFQYETAKALSEKAASLSKTVKIHIKLDTGMGRIGMQPTEESLAEIEKIAALPNIEIDGIFTHFACADEADKTSCNRQKEKYLDFVQKLDACGIHIPIKHMCNSAGIIEFSDNFLNMTRSGIMTYGLYPSEEVNKANLELHPALQLKSHMAFVKTVGKGFTVSYGSTYTTDKENTVIATVPVGYGDGYPRALSNKGKVLIHGQYAPIVGRVCMDQFMVDVTDIPNVQQGDEVTLVGTDGDKRISVEEVADNAYSFNYEFCCGINKRV
ncbi:MAG: alanine racemase, partial [Candidatus Fimenecus sp.]